jgi:hypothetical protein
MVNVMRSGRVDGSRKVYQLSREGFIEVPSSWKSDLAKARYLLRQFGIKVVKDEETDCWHWPLHVAANGYGKWWWDGEVTTAHRWLMEQICRVNLPRKMHVDHAKWTGCAYRDCVNPNHLEIVTAAENIRRGDFIGKRGKRVWDRGAWCEDGHPFSNANTFFLYDREEGVSVRHCKTCEPLRWKRVEKKRAERQANYGKAA